jgi:hypothetical protein
MRCISEEDLSAYADGEISAEDNAQIEAHLSQCARCRKALARLKKTSWFLKAAIRKATQEADALPPATSRILAEISGISRGTLLWRRILTRPIALAAAILVIISLLGVGFLVGRHFILKEKPSEVKEKVDVEVAAPTPSEPQVLAEDSSEPPILYVGIIDAARYDEKTKSFLIREFSLPADFFEPEKAHPEEKGEALFFTGLGKERPFATLEEIMEYLELEESGKEG